MDTDRAFPYIQAHTFRDRIVLIVRDAQYHLKPADARAIIEVLEKFSCSHCGKPSDYIGSCGVGGCPLGLDL